MGTEKFLGYPLAVATSIALMSPQSPTYGDQGVEGAGGTHRGISYDARTDNRRHESESPVANPTPPGRPTAETIELRSLREAESRLFPGYLSAPRDQKGAEPPTASCETPGYDLARSASPEVAAAPDWLKGLTRPEIAVPRDAKIAKYLRHFGASADGRAVFSTWLRRSGAYRQVVNEALEKRGLPKDLMAVMFVESGCWPKAVSPAGAVGLWQFMPQTAKAYGLTVRADYDERRSIWKATDAALNHLADLYNQFQSWHLALAAYNLGYQRLLDRLTQTGTEDFFSLTSRSGAIPAETALYVPKILAVAVILRNLEYFGFDDVEQLPTLSASRISVPPNTELSLLARAAGTSVKKLRDINPQFLTDEVPDLGTALTAYLPNSGLSRAKVMLPRLLNADVTVGIEKSVTSDFDWGRDEIESDWKARLNKTMPGKRATVEQEAEAATNDSLRIPMRHSAENSPGSRLTTSYDDVVASSRRNESHSTNESAYAGTRTFTKTQPVRYYRIKQGDTLSQLARAFDVSQQDLARANGIIDPSRIMAGTKLRIYTKND